MRAATADQRGGGSDGAQQTAWRRQGRRQWAPRPVALRVRAVDKVGGEVLRFEIKWLAAQTWIGLAVSSSYPISSPISNSTL
jgi:hypothetical protein